MYMYLLLTALLGVHFKSAGSALVQIPKDAIVIANHSTVFNCSKSIDKSRNNSEELTWYHQPLGEVPTDVYEDGRIRDKYKGRFNIDKGSTPGIFNLLVLRPESKDSGTYECVENVLEGTGASAELIVLDSKLSCESDTYLDEIVGSTECAQPISPDQLQLLCSVTYSGNFPPQMKWRKVGSELQPNETKCNVRGNRVMCNVTLEANFNMDGSVYTCQVITAEHYNCSFTVNKPIYAFANNRKTESHTGDEVTCVANASKQLSCSYQWYKSNSTAEVPYEVPKPSGPGLYTCQAQCLIRNYICNFTAMVINVSVVHAPDTKLGTGYIVLIAIVVVLTVCAVIIILVCLFRKRCPKKKAAEIEGLLMGETEGVVVDINEIPKICVKKNVINKGSSGDFYGPFVFQGIKCACESIWFEPNASVTEEEVCDLGKRWMQLDHRNVLKFHSILFESPVLYVVMDYAEGGSVRTALNKCTEDLEVSLVKDWAAQIADGMNYLHSNNIIHGHLKAAQTLIMEPFDPTSSSRQTLKIASYRLTKESGQSGPITYRGMFAWMAPEAIRGESTGKAGDVWSYGVTIWEILTRAIPHDDVKQTDLIKDLSTGSRTLSVPSRCPETLRDILNGCWKLKVDRRSTISQVVSRLHKAS